MLYEKKNIIFTNIKGKKEFQDENDEYIPRSEVVLDIGETDKERIVKEILDEKKAIDEEWEDLGILKDITARRKQYSGDMVQLSNDEFTDIESGLTKDKCRSLSNRIYRTITSTDPLFSISARPGYSQLDTDDSVQAQEDFIDYAVDERMNFKPMIKRAIHDSTIVKIGFIKFVFDIETQKKKTKERFKSSPVWKIDIEGEKIAINDYETFQKFMNALPDGANPQVNYENPGFEAFVLKYPEYEDTRILDKLYIGEDVEEDAEYEETISCDPKAEFVKLENIRFRAYCDTYKDLAETKLITENKEFTYHQLKKLEKEERFYGIDKLFDKKEREGEEDCQYKRETYDILECTYYANLEGSDDVDDEVKCVFWISEEKKVMLGSELYSIDEVPCNYVPFKPVNEENGLLAGASVAEDVASEDATITMIMRFMLEAWYYKNTISPITDNQEVINDFIERLWTHGMPMKAKKGDIDFVGNHINAPDLRGGLELMAATAKMAENKIGITSGMSGGADPVDPNAPATKTLALLNESKPDLINYIENIAPSLNQCGYIILAMYAQLTEEDIPYRVRKDRVVKKGKIAKISKAALSAKTNLQTQAYAFAVDEVMLKKELVTFFQMIRNEPLFAMDPENVNNLLRAIGKAWNPQIRNKIDEILPTNETLEAGKAQTAMQGVMMYVQMVLQNAKMTGQQPEFDPRQLVQIVSEHVKDMGTQPQKEEIEGREKRNEQILTQG